MREASDHAQTRRTDGDLGPRTREELVAAFGPALAEVAWKAEPGSLTEVVPTPEGFLIAKVKSRLPARAPDLDSLRDLLRAQLRRERREQGHRQLIEELRRDLRPEVDEALLTALPAAP